MLNLAVLGGISIAIATPSFAPTLFLPQTQKWRIRDVSCSSSIVEEQVLVGNARGRGREIRQRKERVFFLDVNPICYHGSTPSLRSFAHWIYLFFSQVNLRDPVIAVLKIEGQEADDVIATLAEQVLDRGNRVVIASPDKDFKQLISEDVQLVIPIPELQRWSFYTLKQYFAQYNCDPQSDGCILGDEVDGVPGIQNLVAAFGRKTALKLLKKHGSLENLLNAAAVRTVARQYALDAPTKYAFELRRNYQVLALRRDIDVHILDEWLSRRDASNDLIAIAKLYRLLGES